MPPHTIAGTWNGKVDLIRIQGRPLGEGFPDPDRDFRITKTWAAVVQLEIVYQEGDLFLGRLVYNDVEIIDKLAITCLVSGRIIGENIHFVAAGKFPLEEIYPVEINPNKFWCQADCKLVINRFLKTATISGSWYECASTSFSPMCSASGSLNLEKEWLELGPAPPPFEPEQFEVT